MAQIPPALQPLLGDDVTAVTEEQLQGLVDREEGQLLEFKRELGSQKANREFAIDVAALANGGGGLLLIGVDDDGESGRATGIAGVPVAGDLALRVETILGDLVQPPLPLSVGRVVLASGKEVVLVAVEGGPLRPHAVREGESKLTYTIRRGRKKQHLTEPEVADAYARRFTSAGRRAEDLAELRGAMERELDTSVVAWMVVSLLPSDPGFLPVHPRIADETRTWANARPRVTDRAFWDARIGYRSVRLANRFEGTATQKAILRSDGASSVAFGHLTQGFNKDGTLGFARAEGEPPRLVRTVPVVLETVSEAVFMLGAYAHRAGATGSADLSVQMVTADDCLTTLMGPGQSQHYIGMPETVELEGSSQVSAVTVDLGTLAVDSTTTLAVAAMLTRDLISEYGQAGLYVINDEGQLDPRLTHAYAPHLESWARDERLLP